MGHVLSQSFQRSEAINGIFPFIKKESETDDLIFTFIYDGFRFKLQPVFYINEETFGSLNSKIGEMKSFTISEKK